LSKVEVELKPRARHPHPLAGRGRSRLTEDGKTGGRRPGLKERGGDERGRRGGESWDLDLSSWYAKSGATQEIK